jgi:hypothetical protein
VSSPHLNERARYVNILDITSVKLLLRISGVMCRKTRALRCTVILDDQTDSLPRGRDRHLPLDVGRDGIWDAKQQGAAEQAAQRKGDRCEPRVKFLAQGIDATGQSQEPSPRQRCYRKKAHVKTYRGYLLDRTTAPNNQP